MTSLIPRTHSRLSTSSRVPETFSRNEGKELERRQNAAVADGLVTATTVQAKGFVTMVAVQLVGSLSREAAFQHGGDPRVAARTELLLDQFTMTAANEIGRM